jgi:hypothetical protein
VLANECGQAGINFIRGRYCVDYYSCTNLEIELTCPDGYWFDMGYQSCLRQDLVVCTDDCIDETDGTFLARPPGGCAAFWRCYQDRGVPLYCPDGLHFEPTDGGICNYPNDDICEGPTEAPTIPTAEPTTPTPPTAPTIDTTLSPPPTNTPPGNISCTGRPDGTYIPFPPNGCGGWQRCLNGVTGSTGTCPNGMYFDYAGQMCNWSDLVNCNL